MAAATAFLPPRPHAWRTRKGAGGRTSALSHSLFGTSELLEYVLHPANNKKKKFSYVSTAAPCLSNYIPRVTSRSFSPLIEKCKSAAEPFLRHSETNTRLTFRRTNLLSPPSAHRRITKCEIRIHEALSPD